MFIFAIFHHFPVLVLSVFNVNVEKGYEKEEEEDEDEKECHCIHILMNHLYIFFIVDFGSFTKIFLKLLQQ